MSDEAEPPEPKPVKFTIGSRKHRIGRIHALAAMIRGNPELTPPDAVWKGDQFRWVAADDRGRVLEVVAVDRPDCLLVIHVMPTALRSR